MWVEASISWIDGRLRHGHYEVNVPEEEEEVFKKMSEEEQISYIEDNGHIVIDDFDINDYGDITEINY